VKAFLLADDDPRNEMLVLEDMDEVVIGYLQITYIRGLGRGGTERALLEAIRVRPDGGDEAEVIISSVTRSSVLETVDVEWFNS
jgi:hypothetical protein